METTPAAKTPKSRALAAMDAVEIKVTIRPDQELRAERAMEVNEDTAEVRMLYFYDTPDLRLFNAGVALRARLVKGDADDSTVKFRPVKAARISRDWKQLEGSKWRPIASATAWSALHLLPLSSSAVRSTMSQRESDLSASYSPKTRALSERVLQRFARFGTTPRNGPHSRVALEAQAQKLSS